MQRPQPANISALSERSARQHTRLKQKGRRKTSQAGTMRTRALTPGYFKYTHRLLTQKYRRMDEDVNALCSCMIPDWAYTDEWINVYTHMQTQSGVYVCVVCVKSLWLMLTVSVASLLNFHTRAKQHSVQHSSERVLPPHTHALLYLISSSYLGKHLGRQMKISLIIQDDGAGSPPTTTPKMLLLKLCFCSVQWNLKSAVRRIKEDVNL